MSSKSDFIFGRQVGAGTYGLVWQALRRLDGKTYAVKELDLTCLDKQTVLGLQHMHNKGVLHRDIKSLNLLLDANNTVKIADLGIATVVSSPKGFASTLVGTPYYLSPELCEGKPYNEKSDIWAVGVVLYECCTGRYPFDGQSQAALVLKITAGQYAAVTGYSADLHSLIKRCLTHSPDRRPSTDRILTLPAVRAKAHQLGIELPKSGYTSKAVIPPQGPPACTTKAPRYTSGKPCMFFCYAYSVMN
ncbi:hypothetical protein ABBQ38_011839 [Trebouxia sp. C0009 RCD-2024]